MIQYLYLYHRLDRNANDLVSGSYLEGLAFPRCSLPRRDNHPVPSNPLIASRCNIHLRCFFSSHLRRRSLCRKNPLYFPTALMKSFQVLGKMRMSLRWNMYVSSSKYQKQVLNLCAGSSRPPRGETGVGGRPAKGLGWIAGEQRINIWWKTWKNNYHEEQTTFLWFLT